MDFIATILHPNSWDQEMPSVETAGFVDETGDRSIVTFTPPRRLYNLEEDITNDGVNIFWSVSNHGADCITHYDVTITERGRQLMEHPIPYTYLTPSDETHFLFSTPRKDIPYDVSVRGVGRIGKTPPK